MNRVENKKRLAIFQEISKTEGNFLAEYEPLSRKHRGAEDDILSYASYKPEEIGRVDDLIDEKYREYTNRYFIKLSGMRSEIPIEDTQYKFLLGSVLRNSRDLNITQARIAIQEAFGTVDDKWFNNAITAWKSYIGIG